MIDIYYFVSWWSSDQIGGCSAFALRDNKFPKIKTWEKTEVNNSYKSVLYTFLGEVFLDLPYGSSVYLHSSSKLHVTHIFNRVKGFETKRTNNHKHLEHTPHYKILLEGLDHLGQIRIVSIEHGHPYFEEVSKQARDLRKSLQSP